MNEASVPLAQPLESGQTIQLDVAYSGLIALTAQRLLVRRRAQPTWLCTPIGTRSASPFTGLRGFGNVVWYPVASLPALLGDGARLFDEIGEHKLRLSGAHFRLRLAMEFPHGQAPTVALVNGHSVPLSSLNPARWTRVRRWRRRHRRHRRHHLGFEAPSLFAAIRTPHNGQT